ncbi:hypothetical protein GCM10010236_10380 [Streptomyces eurythermus]|nr:hypothetical protein GCM10010236_10380 [Streptomyces eurythermus]
MQRASAEARDARRMVTFLPCMREFVPIEKTLADILVMPTAEKWTAVEHIAKPAE